MKTEVLAHSGEFHVLDLVLMSLAVVGPVVAIVAVIVIAGRRLDLDDDEQSED